MSSVSLVQGALNVVAYGTKYYTETLSTFYSTASHHIHMLHIYVSLPLPHLDHGFGHLLSRDPLGTPLANIDTEVRLDLPYHNSNTMASGQEAREYQADQPLES